MKKPLLLLLAVLTALGAGYWGTRLAMPLPADGPMTAEAKIGWLAEEFRLKPDAAEAVRLLQKAYAPVCARHCEDIARARQALSAAGDDLPARAGAEAELERLKKVCGDATRAHLEAVASHMAPAQAARFLAMMEPRVAHHGHRAGPPGFTHDGSP